MKRPGKYLFLFLLFTLGGTGLLQATHYRAGEILYEVIGRFQIRATVITYAKWSSPSNLADRDTVNIQWGDGTNSMMVRSNGPDANGNQIPDGEFVADDIKKNIYTATHTYPGFPPTGFFVISFLDQNRMAGINNISNGNSVEIPFYVEDTIYFANNINNIGFNSSPVLLHPPIDYANVNDTFVHNPLAVDANGDSLIFELKVPLANTSSDVPVYKYPDQYCREQGQPNNTLTIDRFNGQITWATPCVTGFFNIAILITEYRNGLKIGTMIRDMQIIVLNINNDPPKITALADTCIRAGDTLLTQITATDPQTNQRITLSADGGPFVVSVSPATFPTVTGNPPVTSTFNWKTTCDHIRAQPYLVLFTAADNYRVDANTSAPLVDLQPWQIRVIPPEVEDLTGTVNRQTVTLSWKNPYKCAGSPNFRGFSVWRKIGCDPYTPEYCETGLAGRGYTRLTTTNILSYTYTDNTAIVGQAYSYRVVAEFYKLPPSGAENLKYDVQQSVASNEVCVFVPIDVPVIINVSVNTTDEVNGEIFVRWTRPLAGGIHLDTIQNPPPYRFEIYRSQGFTFTDPATLVHTSPIANSFAELNDTTFTDSGLNTVNTAWNYKILFFSNGDTVGGTEAASSIFLDVLPSDKSLTLTWQERVPWLNDSFSIFKFNKITSVFDSLGISYTHTFSDTGLINDSIYCYYVKGYGHYTVGALPSPLINLSQEDCASPSDSTPPCPPTLNIHNDCERFLDQSWDSAIDFTNFMQWTNQYDSCAFDIRAYYIYFGNDTTGLALLDSIISKDDTTYEHSRPDNLEGCYAITAIDRAGNESQFSNIICIDNCPFYILPNAFTPNGIGKNELFHPLYRHRFVTRIEMKIYNRWGELVFETTNPDINWDGKDQKTGKDLSEGVYLYAGYYYENRQGGEIRRPLSGQKKGGGFIHLIRGK